MAAYIAAMVGFGIYASRQIKSADDYATARGSYGPLLLALAFASTAASGATFLGVPGLAYTHGVSILWIAFLYPIGIYLGVLICQKNVAQFGNQSGARSIPEYLGERYQSEALRISAAILSLLLLFYLAGQLVAGLVMFEMMLGLSKGVALTITAVVLLGYVTLGGAHADILTDGAQSFLMIVLAIAIAVLFFTGFGVGGFDNLLASLEQQDPTLLNNFNQATPITSSTWSYITVVIAHIPLGLLPHIGNKLWALKNQSLRSRFLILAFIFGMILPMMALGGLLARALLGDDLIGNGANTALPALFLQLFPSWLAALLGIGVLAAIMSTADGLLISTSQVFANDIYRRSIAPRWQAHISEADLDKIVLQVSRVVTVLTLLGAIALGWSIMHLNITLLIWAGVGGFTAALMGPLVLGSLWKGLTPAAALSGFWVGAISFVVIHSGWLSAQWAYGSSFDTLARSFDYYAASPYSAATIGGLLSLICCYTVSQFTKANPTPIANKAA